jgi:hypothetical protein
MTNGALSIAEHLAGRNFMVSNQGDVQRMPNACSSNPAITSLTRPVL